MGMIGGTTAPLLVDAQRQFIKMVEVDKGELMSGMLG
jgi:hypothetical protein